VAPAARHRLIDLDRPAVLSLDHVAGVDHTTVAAVPTVIVPVIVSAMRALAAKEAQRDPRLSPSEAYSRAMSSTEGRALRALASESPGPDTQGASSGFAAVQARQQWRHLVNQVANENPHLSPSEV
jgi:hypothetical protein